MRPDYVDGVDAAGGVSFALQHHEDQTGTLQTLPGYDDVTSVGSPFGPAFLKALGK